MKDYYQGYRRIKVDFSGRRLKPQWHWVHVIKEGKGFLICERVNKQCDPIGRAANTTYINIIPLSIIEKSREAIQNRKYAELETV